MSNLRSALFAMMLSVSFLLGAAADAADSPTAYAAWSQIVGEIDPAKGAGLNLPTVELRFVTRAGEDCGNYTATTGGAQTGAVATPRTGAWTDVTVCTIAMQPAWDAATLEKYNDGRDPAEGSVPVVLDSKINRGSYVNTSTNVFFRDSGLTTPSLWVPGVSDGKTVTVAGAASIGQRDKLTLVTVGDTGCRGKQPGHGQQDCETSAGGDAWPFAELAVQAAIDRPDLVIHVGDYRYFFEHDSRTTQWIYWQKDFFPAAQPLLLAAPWVFTRGNHESCIANSLPFGQGYFQLFGTAAGESCEAIAQGSTKGSPNQYMKPWYFDVLATGQDATLAHRFVILDANDFGAGITKDEARHNFETAHQVSKGGPASSWWAMHTPSVQVIYFKGKEHDGKKDLRDALGKATDFAMCGTADAPAPCRPSQFLLGHVHLQHSVTFPSSLQSGGFGAGSYPWVFPRSFITGHSGTQIVNSS